MVILTWLAAISISISLGLLIYLMISSAGEFIVRWRDQRRSNSFASVVENMTRSQTLQAEEPETILRNIPKVFYPVIALAVAIALWIGIRGGIIVSVTIIGILIGNIIYLGKRDKLEKQAELTQQVESLIAEYYSRWLLNASPFGILEDIAEHTRLDDPIRGIVEQVLTRYRLGEADPLAPFRLSDSYLQQFAYILAQTARANNQSTAAALSEILRSLRLRKKLQKRVNTVTAMVRGEENFLIVANLTAFAAAIFVPLLREYYLLSLTRQMILALSLLMISGGGIYFDREIESLKEKAL